MKLDFSSHLNVKEEFEYYFLFNMKIVQKYTIMKKRRKRKK